MSKYRQSFGKWGETIAENYLTEKGYLIIERNARTPYGELDIVASQKGIILSEKSVERETIIVFVEVKTRSSENYGLPEQAITARKQEHLLSAAKYYLMENPHLAEDWRVDVISVQSSKESKQPMLTHFENVLADEP
jgi:putative endonuclease